MRIIGGEFGRLRLQAVPGMATRPTTDKVKESLFNIIGPYFDGGQSLDLFAGSGGLSIEGISRGIDHAFLVDRQYAAIKTINDNIAVTKHPERFTVLKRDADAALKQFAADEQQFDLVFLDPPYAKQKIVDQLLVMQSLSLLVDGAVVVCETDENAQLPDTIGACVMTEVKHYGITTLTIYRMEGAA